MGSQVPDISLAGIEEATRLYRESVDREAVNLLLNEDFDVETLEKWRVSAKLSKSGVARLLGMAAPAYINIENEKKPLTDHFREALRVLLNQLDTEGFEFHPSDRTKSGKKYRTPRLDYVPVSKLAAPTTDWKRCANPHCSKWFFQTHAKRLYCSSECRHHVGHLRKIGKVVTRVMIKDDERHRVWVRCPHCSEEFMAKGNVISGSAGSEYKRNHPNQSNGQADDDFQEQVHQEVGSLLPDGLLSNDKRSFQSDE
jgi:transcriptional regulator with XRE-family HTH domain